MVLNILTRYTTRNLLCNANIKSQFQLKSFFTWLNIMFNQVDAKRLKDVGSDRVCAEWLLRNGASVKWQGLENYLHNYNVLPKEDFKFKLTEIDASDSSISHYGFIHFKDCEKIFKLILHNCVYLEDEALKQLWPLTNTLTELQVSDCGNISDKGLRYLGRLSNLKNLVMFDLLSVQNKQDLVIELQSLLPKTQICFDDFQGSYFNASYNLAKCKRAPKKKLPEINIHLPSNKAEKKTLVK